MGVYQSKTEPRVRRRHYEYMVAGGHLEKIGKKLMIKVIQQRANIPRRVMPTTVPSGLGGYTFKFDWYEVETD